MQNKKCTRYRFVVQKNNGVWQFESVNAFTPTTKTLVKERLLSTRKYKSAYIDDIFPGCQDEEGVLCISA